jgi:hypothetical protein
MGFAIRSRPEAGPDWLYPFDQGAWCPTVRQFKGVIEEQNALRGYIITTSTFTEEAMESAETLGHAGPGRHGGPGAMAHHGTNVLMTDCY